MKLSRLRPSDFDETLSFWNGAEGMSASGSEKPDAFATFLERNPGLSFKVTDRDRIVGTILCGHDGHRGYVHHLAVAPGYSDRNVGQTLVERSLSGLERLGIERCHIFVGTGNNREFWKSIAWGRQGDLAIFTHDIEYPAVR